MFKFHLAPNLFITVHTICFDDISVAKAIRVLLQTPADKIEHFIPHLYQLERNDYVGEEFNTDNHQNFKYLIFGILKWNFFYLSLSYLLS